MSKPLRRIRVAVRRLTTDTELSNGTLWMKIARLLAGLCLVVLEDLVLVVDDRLTRFDALVHELRHDRILSECGPHTRAGSLLRPRRQILVLTSQRPGAVLGVARTVDGSPACRR